MRHENHWRAQRLYRDRRRGRLMGVCAGVADYVGCNVAVIRFLAIIALLWFSGLTLIAYVALGFMLPTRPDSFCERNTEAMYWRSARRSADEVYGDGCHHACERDMALQRREGYVTSSRYNLDQQFRDLED